ncbi:MAG: alkaline phosphatase [Clostridiaceae bacterium]
MKKISIKKNITALMVLLFTLSAGLQASSAKAYEAGDSGMPKNVIIMISDGCGYSQILSADYFQKGAAGSQVYEAFPVKCAMSTWPSGGTYDPYSAWQDFDYVKNGFTDSAAAATAMSTGTKTYVGAIGVGTNNNNLLHISEIAEALGKSTGVVTTVEMSHATPAGFAAHNTSRENYSDIAREMITETGLDVIMGAGNPYYDNNGNRLVQASDYKYVGGQSIWDGLAAGNLKADDADGDGASDPWKLIQKKSEFESLQSGATPDRVIGIPEVYSTLQQARSGDTETAYAAPLNGNVPSLALMSRAAINVLDNNEKGFFLMIEGGAVDWAGHSNQTGRMIEEEIDFNRAVEAVSQWVTANSSWEDTLLIVTGDHETGYLTGPGSDPGWTAVANKGKGRMPAVKWNGTEHTNSLVPVFAKGAEAAFLMEYADKPDPVRGHYLDNTELFKCIVRITEKNGWLNSGGTWYYYRNGAKVTNSWAQDSHGWCFLNDAGSWVQEGWQLDSSGWCYIKNGYWVDHEMWARDSSGWVRIGSNGYWDGKPGLPVIPKQ